MVNIRTLVAVVLCSSALIGCVSPRSFVDPSVPKLSYEDLRKRAEPLKLKVDVEFQRNGQPFSASRLGT